MPYARNSDLPKNVQSLPAAAQSTFRTIVNASLKQYDGDEEKAMATAWSGLRRAGWSKDPKSGTWSKVEKRYFALDVIEKRDTDHVVFGYASVAVKKNGSVLVDLQDDVVDIEELANAVYDYVEEFHVGGEMHVGDAPSRLIESMVLTPDKLAKMGIPEGTVPLGWWVGYRVADETFARVQEGSRLMFSIEGTAQREEI